MLAPLFSYQLLQIWRRCEALRLHLTNWTYWYRCGGRGNAETCIWEVFVSNFGQGTDHLDWSSSWLSSVPPGKYQDSTSNRLPSLLYRPFSISTVISHPSSLDSDVIKLTTTKFNVTEIYISMNYYNYYVFGHYPSSCLCLKTQCYLFFSGLEIGTNSIDWAQLSRFYLKAETESSLRNVVYWKINRTVFLDKDRTMDNVQKHNSCINVPSSQTFRS
jgi:hypothetical protein